MRPQWGGLPSSKKSFQRICDDRFCFIKTSGSLMRMCWKLIVPVYSFLVAWTLVWTSVRLGAYGYNIKPIFILVDNRYEPTVHFQQIAWDTFTWKLF